MSGWFYTVSPRLFFPFNAVGHYIFNSHNTSIMYQLLSVVTQKYAPPHTYKSIRTPELFAMLVSELGWITDF
ncbi:hypothetical protein VIBNISFn118_140063 [Vibrio nigripulchritudo SFn118]|nr:hypothetical protein VIBNISFn118_140063 [Vibrio nigripulchritudo SFn118]